MKRVMIIGFSGSGKSTLAETVANSINTEATHLDAIHWLPGWVESTREYKIEMLRPVLNRECWVIDGCYRKVLFDERLNSADTVVFLDFNRILCLYRVIKRYFKYRGQSRPDMGDGCPEKIDFEFIIWVLYKGRKKRKKDLKRLKILQSSEPKKQIYILKNPRQVRNFLKNSK